MHLTLSAAHPLGVVAVALLGACSGEVRSALVSSASSGGAEDGASSTSGTTGAAVGSSSSSTGAGGGPPNRVCGAGGGAPFASGNAVVSHHHSTPIDFHLIEAVDPNIFDLTHADGHLYAIVISAEADEVARVEPDGTVTGLFVTDVPVGTALASVDDHFVLHDQIHSYYTTLTGQTEAVYQGPVDGSRASAGIGNIIYSLGVGANDAFGVHTLDLDTGALGLAFAITDGLPDFLAAADSVLLVGERENKMDIGDCLHLRVHLPDGALQQELCIRHPFGEVNGIAFEGGCLAVSDRDSAMIHYFDVTEGT